MSGNNFNQNEIYRKRRKRRRRRIIFKRFCCLFLVIAVLVGGITIGSKVYHKIRNRISISSAENIEIPNWIDRQIISVHNTARRGTNLEAVKNIVIHYVGNPGSTAQNNRDYYEKDDTEVSSHFVVGLDGEIIQCIPLNERSSASNDRNKDTISIEVCHPDTSGKFNDETYNSVVKLSAWLCEQFGLDEKDLIRHYDITGKNCPKYFVEHEDAWNQLKNDVGKKINEGTK